MPVVWSTSLVHALRTEVLQALFKSSTYMGSASRYRKVQNLPMRLRSRIFVVFSTQAHDLSSHPTKKSA